MSSIYRKVRSKIKKILLNEKSTPKILTQAERDAIVLREKLIEATYFIKERTINDEQLNSFIDFLNTKYPKVTVRILDIGARGGLSCSELSPLISLKNKYLVGVEPDTEELSHLHELTGGEKYDELYDVALASNKGNRDLYLTFVRGCSSLLEPNYDWLQKNKFLQSEYFRPEKKITVSTTTLSELFENPNFDFIKIDTQGLEYEIVSSVREDFWNNVIGLLLEAQTYPAYKGQALINSVLQIMHNNRYFLCKLTPYEKEGLIFECDLAFIKTFEEINSADDFLKRILFVAVTKKSNHISYLLRIFGETYLSKEDIDFIQKCFDLPIIPPDYKILV